MFGGKTPKNNSLAPRVRSEEPKASRKPTGCALRLPGRVRGPELRDTTPHAAERSNFTSTGVKLTIITPHTPSERECARGGRWRGPRHVPVPWPWRAFLLGLIKENPRCSRETAAGNSALSLGLLARARSRCCFSLLGNGSRSARAGAPEQRAAKPVIIPGSARLRRVEEDTADGYKTQSRGVRQTAPGVL